MNLQNRYELEVARDKLSESIDKEVRLYPALLDGASARREKTKRKKGTSN